MVCAATAEATEVIEKTDMAMRQSEFMSRPRVSVIIGARRLGFVRASIRGTSRPARWRRIMR
jgi:hypothetical protein